MSLKDLQHSLLYIRSLYDNFIIALLTDGNRYGKILAWVQK